MEVKRFLSFLTASSFFLSSISPAWGVPITSHLRTPPTMESKDGGALVSELQNALRTVPDAGGQITFAAATPVNVPAVGLTAQPLTQPPIQKTPVLRQELFRLPAATDIRANVEATLFGISDQTLHQTLSALRRPTENATQLAVNYVSLKLFDRLSDVHRLPRATAQEIAGVLEDTLLSRGISSSQLETLTAEVANAIAQRARDGAGQLAFPDTTQAQELVIQKFTRALGRPFEEIPSFLSGSSSSLDLHEQAAGYITAKIFVEPRIAQIVGFQEQQIQTLKGLADSFAEQAFRLSILGLPPIRIEEAKERKADFDLRLTRLAQQITTNLSGRDGGIRIPPALQRVVLIGTLFGALLGDGYLNYLDLKDRHQFETESRVLMHDLLAEVFRSNSLKAVLLDDMADILGAPLPETDTEQLAELTERVKERYAVLTDGEKGLVQAVVEMLRGEIHHPLEGMKHLVFSFPTSMFGMESAPLITVVPVRDEAVEILYGKDVARAYAQAVQLVLQGLFSLDVPEPELQGPEFPAPEIIPIPVPIPEMPMPLPQGRDISKFAGAVSSQPSTLAAADGAARDGADRLDPSVLEGLISDILSELSRLDRPIGSQGIVMERTVLIHDATVNVLTRKQIPIHHLTEVKEAVFAKLFARDGAEKESDAERLIRGFQEDQTVITKNIERFDSPEFAEEIRLSGRTDDGWHLIVAAVNSQNGYFIGFGHQVFKDFYSRDMVLVALGVRVNDSGKVVEARLVEEVEAESLPQLSNLPQLGPAKIAWASGYIPTGYVERMVEATVRTLNQRPLGGIGPAAARDGGTHQDVQRLISQLRTGAPYQQVQSAQALGNATLYRDVQNGRYRQPDLDQGVTALMEAMTNGNRELRHTAAVALVSLQNYGIHVFARPGGVDGTSYFARTVDELSGDIQDGAVRNAGWEGGFERLVALADPGGFASVQKAKQLIAREIGPEIRDLGSPESIGRILRLAEDEPVAYGLGQRFMDSVNLGSEFYGISDHPSMPLIQNMMQQPGVENLVVVPSVDLLLRDPTVTPQGLNHLLNLTGRRLFFLGDPTIQLPNQLAPVLQGRILNNLSDLSKMGVVKPNGTVVAFLSQAARLKLQIRDDQILKAGQTVTGQSGVTPIEVDNAADVNIVSMTQNGLTLALRGGDPNTLEDMGVKVFLADLASALPARDVLVQGIYAMDGARKFITFGQRGL